MKIAIVKLSALGDVIHAASVLEFIKHYIPNSQIDWFIEERNYQILEYNPYIDNILKLNLKSAKNSFSNLFQEILKIKKFAKKDYDIVIDMQGLLKSAIVSKILSKNCVGYDKNSIRESLASLFYRSKFDIPYHYNTIDRYRLLVSKALNIDIKKEDILNKKPYLFYDKSISCVVEKFLSSTKKNVVFIIGSTWQSRIYPKEKLVEVARELNANILIPHANENEKKDGLYIQDRCKNVKLLPRMDLNDLKNLISHVDLLIGNDTGPSYIAWANNIPSITLFGPTPPTRIYETDINKMLKSPSKVNPYKLNKNDFSIKKIPSQAIIELANSLLKQDIVIQKAQI